MTADLFKVYRPEWLLVYRSTTLAGDQDADDASAECFEHFADRYEGRVRDEDWKVYAEAPEQPVGLYLRLPNLKGEFKHREDAEAYVEEQGWDDAPIVTRNSPAERELNAYGTKKLPLRQVTDG